MLSRIYSLSAIFGILALAMPHTTPQQSGLIQASTQSPDPNWSEPILLFEGEGDLYTPILTVGRDGNVHLFWRYILPAQGISQDRPEMIYYTRIVPYSQQEPIDILISQTAATPSASVGPDGIIHLIWNGPGNTLYYANAPAGEASNSANWSKPIPIADANLQASIVVDQGGVIHIVYPGLGNSGVYYINSQNGGISWSFPVHISGTAKKTASATSTRLEIDDNEHLHIVWSEFQLPSGWPPTGVFYSNSFNGGKTWLKPVEIAGADYDLGNLVTTRGTINIVYNAQVALRGRFYRFSSDNGKSWSKRFSLTPLGGTEGFPQLAVDGDRNLQFITSYNNCPWYSFQKQDKWSDLACISKDVAKASDWIEEPAMAISEGNRIHVVFWDERKRLWYTTKTLAAKHIDTTPFSVPTQALRVETPTQLIPTSEPTPSAATLQPGTLSPSTQKISSNQVMTVSILPAIGLILTAFLVSRYRSKNP